MSAGWRVAQVPGLVLLMAGAMVVLGLWLLLARAVAGLGWGLAAQGGALALALLGLAAQRGSWGLLGLAGLTLLGKAVVLPRLAAGLSHRLAAPRRVPAVLAGAGVAAVALVLAAAGPVLRPGEALALAVFALGAVALAGRDDLAGQAAGVVGQESGLVLLAAEAGAPAWLGLASAALPCAAGVAVLRRVLAASASDQRGAG